ncbi:TIM barrel protein [Pantoea sp. Eser]|nr:TIM barrel protein [Pantoea sp. Eser]
MTPMNIGLADWRLPVSGRDAIRLAAEVGVEGIQLDLGGPGRSPWLDNPQTLKAISEALTETQVHLLAVSANVLNDTGLCAEPGSSASREVRNIISRAIAADTLGAGLVFFPSFRRSEITNQTELVRTAEVLHWACSQAQQRGLLLATEKVLNPDNLLKFIRMVNSASFRVVLYTGNPLKVGQSPLGVVKVAANLIAPQIHIKVMDENAPLTCSDQIILNVINALNNKGSCVSTLVLENDYRDGVISRLKSDTCWLKKHAIRPSVTENRCGSSDLMQRYDG